MPSDTIDAIIDAFPRPSLTPIDGLPTFVSIRNMQIELNANAASVHSNLGNGQLGLLYLTVDRATYGTLSNVAFVEPPNPGPVPEIPANATSRQATDVRVNHAENLRIFNQYIKTDKALKSQIIKAVDDLYLKTLKNRITGYASVSTRQMLNHLRWFRSSHIVAFRGSGKVAHNLLRRLNYKSELCCILIKY